MAKKTLVAINVMKSGFVQRNTKIRIYRTIIRSILWYGIETWAMFRKVEMGVEGFEWKMSEGYENCYEKVDGAQSAITIKSVFYVRTYIW